MIQTYKTSAFGICSKEQQVEGRSKLQDRKVARERQERQVSAEKCCRRLRSASFANMANLAWHPLMQVMNRQRTQGAEPQEVGNKDGEMMLR